jgi:hypothetical protein
MTMRHLVIAAAALVVSAAAAAQHVPPGGRAELHNQVAALKGALARNRVALAGYSWTETTEVRVAGEVRTVTRKACHLKADGTIRKIAVDDRHEAPGSRDQRRAVVERPDLLKGEIETLAALVHQYIPPDQARTQTAFRAGRTSISSLPDGGTALVFHDYVKPGDRLSIEIDLAAGKIRRLDVSTYSETPADIVTFTAGYEDLPDGTSHVRQSELVAAKPALRVTITNGEYVKPAS